MKMFKLWYYPQIWSLDLQMSHSTEAESTDVVMLLAVISSYVSRTCA
jgi:hypothetical protein